MSYCLRCGAPHLYLTDGDDGWRYHASDVSVGMVCPECLAAAEGPL